MVFFGYDPFGVVSFRMPEGADPAQAAAEFARWQGRIDVIIGRLVMTLVPLMVSGICGVFVHCFLPASVPAALVRMAGVALLLLVVSTVGSRAIERALSTGESSDIGTPVAMLAFDSLCLAMSAPLSSVVTRRRSRGEGRGAQVGPQPGQGE